MKSTGAYYTPKGLSRFICKHIKSYLSKFKNLAVLEPSCGDGVFINSIHKEYGAFSVRVDAIEINEIAIKSAKTSLLKPNIHKVRFYNTDFLSKKINKKYDLVIGNPPYICKNLLDDKQKEECRDIYKSAGLLDKCPPNIWTTFVVKSTQLLTDEGILAFVLPADLLQVIYAKKVQDFIRKQYQRIEVITFDDLLFEGVGQDTIVLIAYKKHINEGLFFANTKNISTLDLNLKFSNKKHLLDNDFKWSANILSKFEFNCLSSALSKIKTISAYSSSCPGVVTGANDYFITNIETIKKFRLQKYSLPIIRKGQYVDEWVEINKDFLDALDLKGYSHHLVNIGDKSPSNGSSLGKFIELGKEQKIHSRYKCSRRSPWYNIPAVWVPDGFIFKRIHKIPKFLKNNAGACVTDSAYRVSIKPDFSLSSLIMSFYNSLTLAFCELNGRFYGDGVLELTPSEFMALPIPYKKLSVNEFENFSNKMNLSDNEIEDCISTNDKQILGCHYGYSNDEIDVFNRIWKKLQKRRLNK